MPDDAPSPERLRGDRYTTIRNYLTIAKVRNGELPVEPLLLGQIAVVLCDILDTLERCEPYLHELAVHGVKVQK